MFNALLLLLVIGDIQSATDINSLLASPSVWMTRTAYQEVAISFRHPPSIDAPRGAVRLIVTAIEDLNNGKKGIAYDWQGTYEVDASIKAHPRVVCRFGSLTIGGGLKRTFAQNDARTATFGVDALGADNPDAARVISLVLEKYDAQPSLFLWSLRETRFLQRLDATDTPDGRPLPLIDPYKNLKDIPRTQRIQELAPSYSFLESNAHHCQFLDPDTHKIVSTLIQFYRTQVPSTIQRNADPLSFEMYISRGIPELNPAASAKKFGAIESSKDVTIVNGEVVRGVNNGDTVTIECLLDSIRLSDQKYDESVKGQRFSFVMKPQVNGSFRREVFVGHSPLERISGLPEKPIHSFYVVGFP